MEIKHCDRCNKNILPRVVPLTDLFRVRELDVRATIQTLVCPYCNQEIWDEQNEMDNDNIVFSKYNKLTLREKIKLL